MEAKPVVAGRVGGIQDQIVDGESGVLVDPRDLAAVGTAIDGLLAEPERAARIGRAAQQRVMDEFLQIHRLLEYFEHIEELLEIERGPELPALFPDHRSEGAAQMSSGTILIAPEGHSATHMPQPLQKSSRSRRARPARRA